MLAKLTRQGKTRRGRDERGVVLVEFALTAMIFFMLVFGILDFARLFQSWVTVQHAAREGARYAVTGQVKCTGYTDNRTACITQKAKEATTGLNGGGTSGVKVTVSYQSWDYEDNYADPPNANNAGSQCDAVEIQVSYTHDLVFPLLSVLAPGGVDIAGRQRMVNEPFGPCDQ
jgi:Flp pilus assembly protein TadG